MRPELKRTLLWLSPLTFDGSIAGAAVRSAELIAFDIGLSLVLSSLGANCGGPIAIGTLILVGGQLSVCPRQRDAVHPRWRRLKADPSRYEYHDQPPQE